MQAHRLTLAMQPLGSLSDEMEEVEGSNDTTILPIGDDSIAMAVSSISRKATGNTQSLFLPFIIPLYPKLLHPGLQMLRQGQPSLAPIQRQFFPPYSLVLCLEDP